MMSHIFLLDVATDPVSAGVGIAGLILIGIVVSMMTAAMLVGFVFLFKRLKRSDAGGAAASVVGDVCLNLDNAASQSNPGPQSSPNQT